MVRPRFRPGTRAASGGHFGPPVAREPAHRPSPRRTMKQLENLRAELERLFDKDEPFSLSRDVLGFDPDVGGGQTNVASFAGALLGYCERKDAIEALCDALRNTDKDLSPVVAQIASGEQSNDADLGVGD